MDDLVFEGRNQAYGAYQLRRRYDERMTSAMIIAMLIFLLGISFPRILLFIKGLQPQENNVLEEITHVLYNPPVDVVEFPLATPILKVDLPAIKHQIKFVLPVVKKDIDVPADIPSIATNDSIIDKLTGNTAKAGDSSAVDPSLIQDFPPGPIYIEEPEPTNDVPFTYVEQMPEFPDGLKAMYEYINKESRYPSIARDNRISGTVVLQFVVSKEGDLKNIKVVKGFGGGLNEEAVRVVSGMPRWKPGRHNGKPVPVTYTLPFKFVLQ